MQIIEFLGIARSGKTTIAKALVEKFPNIKYFPERHDLVPRKFHGKHFEYNLWYAKYCIDNLNSALEKDGIYIFERGIVDRIVIGRVYYKMGWFTKEQLKEYEALLIPNVNLVNKVFVFLIPVNESVKRAKRLGKDVSEAIPYMINLYSEYEQLHSWISNSIYLPSKSNLKELEIIRSKEIKYLLQTIKR